MSQVERQQTQDTGRIIQLIREARDNSPEQAFEVSQREVPQLTNDCRLLIVNLPKMLPGFWTKLYRIMEASKLLTSRDFREARKGEALEELVAHLNSDYLDGAREKRVLLDEVFLSVREYLRPTAAKGGE